MVGEKPHLDETLFDVVGLCSLESQPFILFVQYPQPHTASLMATPSTPTDSRLSPLADRRVPRRDDRRGMERVSICQLRLGF